VFSLRWSSEAQSQYEALRDAAQTAFASRQRDGKSKSSRQEGLFKQVHKTLMYLSNNPRHPGLRTHKYRSISDPSGQNREIFEAYAQNDTPGAYRVFWCYGPGRGEITIVAITSHP
jgi:hypothetical protein